VAVLVEPLADRVAERPRGLPALVDRLAQRLADDRVVRVVERVEDLVRDPGRERLIDAAPLARELAEHREHVDAVDVLHRDVERVADPPELERLGDLRMDQARRELGLVDEHRRVGRVVDEVRQEPLDHDLLQEAVLAGRGRHEQLGHAAYGEPLDKIVPAEANRKIAHRSRPYHRWRGSRRP
jgi:hypothetical protein